MNHVTSESPMKQLTSRSREEEQEQEEQTLDAVRLQVFHDFGDDDNETEEEKHLLPQDEVLQPRWKYHSYF